jgi:hypothetical protein
MASSDGKTIQPISWAAILHSRHIALPSEHGAWVFLLSPLMIGAAAGGVRPASLLLLAAILAGFLIRQPLTMLVKVLSGRRPGREWSTILFWLVIYAIMGLSAVLALMMLGYGFLIWLALPAVPVFAWHLWLVRRRAERRQMLIEIIASGVLALAAPAALWVGRGQVDGAGWLLWGLVWLQVAGTIIYAYLRLAQRVLSHPPLHSEAMRMARPAFSYNLAILLVVMGLAAARLVPVLLPLAYLIQPLEVVWGAVHPAIGVKPKVIGFRQLLISGLYTLVFIFIWRG